MQCAVHPMLAGVIASRPASRTRRVGAMVSGYKRVAQGAEKVPGYRCAGLEGRGPSVRVAFRGTGAAAGRFMPWRSAPCG
jgi:hypothetical protein